MMKNFRYKVGQFFKQLWEQTWLSTVVEFVALGFVSVVDFLKKWRHKK